MSGGHTPVMLREAVQLLGLRHGMSVVDATVGCGGHAAAILEEIGSDGVLIGIEWDAEALEVARGRLARTGWNVRLHRGNFTELKGILAEEGIEKVDAMFFDLGVSSLQLGDGERGFSLNLAGPLDMRMDRRRRKTAGTLLKMWGAGELEKILREYGEEPLARPIARAVTRWGVPGDTRELADLVARIYRRAGRRSRLKPATRVFQALRIAVNDELANLRKAIPQAIDVARVGGRIVVISFHSLEDRIVKEEFSRHARGCICPPKFPVCRCGVRPSLRLVTKKPLRPAAEEVAMNPRSRSARLRAAERI